MKPEILDISNQPWRLSKEEQKDPQAVLSEFFINYHLNDLREVLWEWLCSGLCHDESWFQEGLHRSNLIFLYENLEKLAEASYLLYRKSVQKDQSKRKSKINKKNSHVSKRKKSTH
ncbi:hypothetical protein [Paraflavitalea sp. CAU 1676]|uniref:hypothetical protein n=1 Tax=Paraflavitalea sp. CAU 1676 TaxID=3032598 RepID=UPI0023DAD007|nr:hypothetical protein [Paraflavitalea sp. CAU 1676]MDF2189823.1 hypothetical protein [Paraflavitalea sp. CAU 1676]